MILLMIITVLCWLQGAPPSDGQVVDTAEQVYISSLALLKVGFLDAETFSNFNFLLVFANKIVYYMYINLIYDPAAKNRSHHTFFLKMG